MKLSKSSMVKISKYAVHCDIEDEVVILAMNDEIYYGLNSVGAFIWNQIHEPKKVKEICSSVLAEFDVDKEKFEADLMELLYELLKKDLIEVVDENN